MPARQLTMQNEGALLQNYNHPQNWEPLSASLVSSPMVAYKNVQRLDLRGLLAGKETGLSVSNVVLQEAGIIDAPVASPTAGLMVVDVLSSVPLEDEVIADMYVLGNESTMPSFNLSSGMSRLASEQSLNLSQVTWGLWRFFAKDRNIVYKENYSVMKALHSGYFGEGEVMVAPTAYWTRVVFAFDNVAESTSYPALIPSANLVVLAQAVDLTVPQEVTAMIRSAQR